MELIDLLQHTEKISNVGVSTSSPSLKCFQARMAFLSLYDKFERLLQEGPNGLILAREYPEFNIRDLKKRKEEIELLLDIDLDPNRKYIS